MMQNAIWYKSYPENVKASIEIDQRTMVDVFYEAVKDNPDHLALSCSNWCTSFITR
ncbi:hypothetical protein ACQKMK_10910 [Viridibacillus arvi]|uniref:hypothetical protein n=1 Tax=Viridibacillus arvi TaxID=263475 RepID=UPI003D08B299